MPLYLLDFSARREPDCPDAAAWRHKLSVRRAICIERGAIPGGMSVREKRLSNCAPLPATASKQLRLAMHCVSRVRADHENVITRLSCCTACRGMEICHCGKSPLSGNRLSRVRFVDGSHEHGVECHIRPRVPSENSRSGGSRPCRVIAEVREIAVAITLASAGLYGTIPKPDRIFLFR